MPAWYQIVANLASLVGIALLVRHSEVDAEACAYG
jgi:hypothetical protein